MHFLHPRGNALVARDVSTRIHGDKGWLVRRNHDRLSCGIRDSEARFPQGRRLRLVVREGAGSGPFPETQQPRSDVELCAKCRRVPARRLAGMALLVANAYVAEEAAGVALLPLDISHSLSASADSPSCDLSPYAGNREGSAGVRSGVGMTIVLIDPHEARGGGQVVLEELLFQLDRRYEGSVVLQMPERGREKLLVPKSVTFDPAHLRNLLVEGPQASLVVVSNANASHAKTLLAARRLRRRGHHVTTVAILHNYPRNVGRTWAVRQILQHYDSSIAVEPGLTRLAPTAIIPSWLSIRAKDLDLFDLDLDPLTRSRSNVVKAFARPDPVKGLHLLPKIFSELTEEGFVCEVALGGSMEQSPRRYSRALQQDLQAWLVAGSRDPSWVLPGEVYLSTSLQETASLAVQEVMARRAIVVAPRVGLVHYLSPRRASLFTYERGNPEHALDVLRGVLDLSGAERRAMGELGQKEIAQRAGAWYDEVVSLLTGLDA